MPGARLEVRDVLGDTATNPRFLETLPKRGYRFIAPVQSQTAENAPYPLSDGDAVATQMAAFFVSKPTVVFDRVSKL